MQVSAMVLARFRRRGPGQIQLVLRCGRPPRRAPECWHLQRFQQGFEARSRPEERPGAAQEPHEMIGAKSRAKHQNFAFSIVLRPSLFNASSPLLRVSQRVQ